MFVAAVAALVSCTEGIAPDIPGIPELNPQEGDRVVVAHYEEQTKFSFNPADLDAHWGPGDLIWISDGVHEKTICLTKDKYQEFPEGYVRGYYNNQDKFTFLVPREFGDVIYAVYPASAARGIDETGGIKVEFPSHPKGSDAIFLTAKGELTKNEKDLYFKWINGIADTSKLPDFGERAYVDRSSTTKVSIKASCPITGPVTVHIDGSDIDIDTSTLNCEELVSDSWLIAFPPMEIPSISYEYRSNLGLATAVSGSNTIERAHYYEMGEIPEDKVMTVPDFLTIDGIRCVRIGHRAWALDNLALSDSGKKMWKGKRTEGNTKHVVGDYFQWGAYRDYAGRGYLYYDSFDVQYVEGMSGANKFYRGGVAISNPDEIGPYYSKNGATKYSNGESLEDSDDVVTKTLGSKWHIPSKQEYYSALFKLVYAEFDETDMGAYVYIPKTSDDAGKFSKTPTGRYNKANSMLFFPYAGYAECMEYTNPGLTTYYLTKDSEMANEFSRAIVYAFYGNHTGVGAYHDSRASGYLIRPIANL